MTDLLCIDRTPVDHSLKSFPQNGVEGLVDIEIKNGVGEGEGDAFLKPVDILFLGSSFQEIGAESHRLTESLKIRIDIEDLNWEGNVEDALTREEIFF